MDQAIKFISQVGFPIAVAAFLLWRMDKSLRELKGAVQDLTRAVQTLAPKGGP